MSVIQLASDDGGATKRARALSMVLGGLKDMQAREDNQKAQTQTRRQQAFQYGNELAKQGIDPSQYKENLNQFVETGDTQALSPISSAFSERAKEQREYDREQKRLDRAYQTQDRDLDRQLKQQKLASARREAELGPEPKQNQYQAAGFVKRAELAEKELANLDSDYGTDWYQGITGSDLFPEAFKSEDQKKFDQTQRNFISAVLRKESGAAIGDDEYDREQKKYFPMPGDSAEVLAQKKRARQQAMANLRAEAGSAYNRIASVEIPEGVPNQPGGTPAGMTAVNMPSWAAEAGIPHVPNAGQIPGAINMEAVASDPNLQQQIISPERAKARSARLAELRAKAGR